MNQPAPATDSDERRRPWQRRSMRIGLALGAAVVLYLAFEIGRFSAGYSILAALHEHDVLRGQIAALRGNNRALQAHVVELQTLNAGHAHAEQVVTRTIAQLQAQIARQQEKLAFYRGVVAQGAPPVGLRVGEVLLSAGKRPLHFHVDISLLRADRPDGEVSGALSFTVEGQGPGETTLGNRTLTGKPTDLKYRFRYYQEFKEVIVLPPGFRPLRLTVTVRSSRTNIAPLVQSYPWSAVSVP